MDKKVLVDKDIDAGARLLQALKRSGFPIHSALWFYSIPSDNWRLVIASPAIEQSGPIKAYTLVQSILNQLSEEYRVSLDDIAMMRPGQELLQLLATSVKIPPGASGVRLTRSTIGNHYIEDAYLYRVD